MPQCKYPLKGLPATNHCPECGFEYDSHTRMWRRATPRHKAILLWTLFLANALAAFAFMSGFYSIGSYSGSVFLLVAHGLVAFVLLVGPIRRMVTPYFVLVGPEGVMMTSIRWRRKKVPWQTVRVFRESPIWGGIVIQLTLKTGGFVNLPAFLNTTERADVAAAIRSRLAAMPDST